MNVAIIGCGLVGLKRAKAIIHEHCLVAVHDPIAERAQKVAEICHPPAQVESYQKIMMRSDVEAIIIATTHDALAQLTLDAIRHNKHVLVEKPGARNPQELIPIIQESQKHKVCIHVGFNHRFHPAIQKAKEMIISGVLGDLMYVRGRYGHGGRFGYEKEWRANPEISGGGELMDQGVHLVDLSRWFLGELVHATGWAQNYFWKMPVEDNGFMFLQTARQQTAWLHVSCTEWKNLFSYEIFGQYGKLLIEGLGGSYGTEKLIHYQMKPEMGPPDIASWEFPGEDVSWKLEFEDFVQSIKNGTKGSISLEDASATLQIIHSIYQSK